MKIEEDFYTYLWQFGLFFRNNLQTTDGESVEVITTGRWSGTCGPDFVNAHIKMNGIDWFGSVEIHSKASDWKKHQHQGNPHYDNVILHVVGEYDHHDVYNTQKVKIPTLVLHYPEAMAERYQQLKENPSVVRCENLIHKIPSFTVGHFLSRMGMERLVALTERLAVDSSDKIDWDTLFYHTLLRSFGLPDNSLPCELLSLHLPVTVLQKHANNVTVIEALLFGQAGFLENSFQNQDDYCQLLHREYTVYRAKYQLTPIDVSLWKFGKNRPQNYPTIRLSQFAQWITRHRLRWSDVLQPRTLEGWHQFFECQPTLYWESHYRFSEVSTQKSKKQIGKSFIDRILGNVIVPLLFYYGKHVDNDTIIQQALDLWEMLPSEKNRYTDLWSTHFNTPRNMLESQAVLHLVKNYCSHKLCVRCDIGSRIMIADH